MHHVVPDSPQRVARPASILGLEAEDAAVPIGGSVTVRACAAEDAFSPEVRFYAVTLKCAPRIASAGIGRPKCQAGEGLSPSRVRFTDSPGGRSRALGLRSIQCRLSGLQLSHSLVRPQSSARVHRLCRKASLP